MIVVKLLIMSHMVFTAHAFSRYQRFRSVDFSTALHGNKSKVSVETYSHEDWKLTYLYKAPAAGQENDPAIIFVHPVGAGISSWFWERVMNNFSDNPALYAPDLIGCGIEHGADAWIPEEKGMFFPLSWVQGIETLIQEQILSGNTPKECHIVVQGGLAVVGVLLAHRNPGIVSKLILSSPPPYNQLINSVPQSDLQRNYNILRSRFFGDAAFSVLETRWATRFFSDLFLFAGACDEDWLDKTKEGALKEARPPVQSFNAGLLEHRSFKSELKEIEQDTLIISGKSDQRQDQRESYKLEMKRCEHITMSGCNVLPWESYHEFVEILRTIK
jgi:pimeloyl-ACP methyl ester carboxylesterase